MAQSNQFNLVYEVEVLTTRNIFSKILVNQLCIISQKLYQISVPASQKVALEVKPSDKIK